jgi:hypothetical protein
MSHLTITGQNIRHRFRCTLSPVRTFLSRVSRFDSEAYSRKHYEFAAGAKDENTDASLGAIEQAIEMLASRITEIMAT